MLRRIVWFFIAFPVAILLITLAVANRHGVRLVLDPFRPADPVISLVLPFYAYLFGALLIGVIIGGAATWITQASWRLCNARQRATQKPTAGKRLRPAASRREKGTRSIAAHSPPLADRAFCHPGALCPGLIDLLRRLQMAGSR